MTYHYTLQKQYNGDIHWDPLVIAKYDHPLGVIEVLDQIFAIFQNGGITPETIDTRKIRIAVFETDKKKRVDQIGLGTMRSLYQMYLIHGSVHSSVVSSLRNKEYPTTNKIQIDT